MATQEIFTAKQLKQELIEAANYGSTVVFGHLVAILLHQGYKADQIVEWCKTAILCNLPANSTWVCAPKDEFYNKEQWYVFHRVAADGLHEFIVGPQGQIHLDSSWNQETQTPRSYGDAHFTATSLFIAYNRGRKETE
jgi:hypothetical protein